MSDPKQAPPQTAGVSAELTPQKPKPPEREPKGEADWRVSVRHTPLKVKSLVVRAAGKKAAWNAFLDAAERTATEEQFKADPDRLKRVREWLQEARRGMPESAELLSEEYRKGRVLASMAKGTVTADNVGGYTELASVPTYQG